MTVEIIKGIDGLKIGVTFELLEDIGVAVYPSIKLSLYDDQDNLIVETPYTGHSGWPIQDPPGSTGVGWDVPANEMQDYPLGMWRVVIVGDLKYNFPEGAVIDTDVLYYEEPAVVNFVEGGQVADIFAVTFEKL